MTIQTANLGTPPSGVGGDTFRTAATKFNENFTNNEHAASRLVGTQSGNVMEVGAFGLGGVGLSIAPASDLNFIQRMYGRSQIARRDEGSGVSIMNYAAGMYVQTANTYFYLNAHHLGGGVNILVGAGDIAQPLTYILKTNLNTTVDANGFIKSASPIVKLFADHIELNDEAKKQEITFEKIGTGDYLLKGSSGFAQEGWYIETPKDANGNLLVAVVYEQLENGDISVKTYDYMLNNKGRIVVDTETPLDIPEARWIDIRLQELPQPEFVPPVSNTPASFQPTGISQAVSEMMNGTEQ